MPRRPEDVAKLKSIVLKLADLAEEVPPGYDTLKQEISNARSKARRELGTILAELELGE